MGREASGESEWGGLYEGALKHSLNSKKGQAALSRLRAALLALPERVLIADALSDGGHVCAIGALACYQEVEQNGRTWDQAMAIYDDGPDGDWASHSETIALARKLGFSWTLADTVVQRNDSSAIAYVGGIYVQMDDELRYWGFLGWLERMIIDIDTPTTVPAAIMARVVEGDLNKHLIGKGG